ncbi:MAG: RHS repeat-associated core domain-containing protein, partial [Verrucomicrobia bacterium]|nr:RHS repeat-associated core domain-containing protein [Verrucomicrobiota bacterium]
ARWYNPETGRWLSKDPIGISGGLNQYVFVENNPVNFVDPEGLTVKSKAKAAVLAARIYIQAVAGEAGPQIVRAASKGKAVATQIAKKIGPKGAAGIGGILTLVMTPTTANAGEADYWRIRRQLAEDGWVEGEGGVFYPPEKPEC